jgi:hypothetical protein
MTEVPRNYPDVPILGQTKPEPESATRQITDVYAWLVTDGDGNESVASVDFQDITVPLMNADERRLRRFIPQVRKAARDLGAPARLVRFTRTEVMYEAEPL